MALTLYGNAPAFAAYGNYASQSLANTTFTKVVFNAETFDTNSNFDTATYRFTPTVAGYYQLNASIGLSSTGGASVMICAFFKNGVEYRRSDNRIGSTMYQINAAISDIVYFNGSTDYVEVYGYISGGGTLSVYGAGGSFYYTWFSGSLVRSTA